MGLIVIKGRLPTLNEQIKADRTSSFVGNNLKKKYTNLCAWQAKSDCKDKFDAPIHIDFFWYEENKKRDKDNICFAKKYILDGLILAGVIKNDGWSGVESFTDSFEIDAENPRIEIKIS